MSTKKPKTSRKVFEKLGPFSIMRKPIIKDEGKVFAVDVTTEIGENSIHDCTKDLYREITSDRLYSNYRVMFYLHKNSSGKISNISTSPKKIYDNQSYTVEYEEDMEVPDKDIYKDPAD